MIVFGQTTFAECTPFHIYKNVRTALPPKISAPAYLEKDWEEKLLAKIGKIKTQEEFPSIYRIYKEEHKELSENERFLWLRCIDYFVSLDTNKNGIPDWTAIIDNQPTKVLFPGEDDIDGDGVTNVLDSDPLDEKVKGTSKLIPEHLKIESETQEQLYSEFGIIAINHTDEHSTVVLNELLSLLRTGFAKNWIQNLKNLKYVYAFLGHDPEHRIAAYHWQAKALSIGGIHAYKGELSDQQKIELKAALAHEIGHAALLEKLSVGELAAAGRKFGGWGINPSPSPLSFYAKIFFAPYSWGSDYKNNNIVSAYALTNIHEWFADSFAAYIINKLGQVLQFQNLKRKNWTDYGNLTTDYRHWLDTKIFLD